MVRTTLEVMTLRSANYLITIAFICFFLELSLMDSVHIGGENKGTMNTF